MNRRSEFFAVVRRVVAPVALLLFMVGCSVLEPKPDTSRYFLLRPAAAPTGSALPDLVLGLGPVTVPDYMDRNEMLDVVGPYELRYSAQNRWVEPLGTQVRRTLADNLRTELKPDAILSQMTKRDVCFSLTSVLFAN